MVTARFDFLCGFFLEAHDEFMRAHPWQSFGLSGPMMRVFTLEHLLSKPRHKPSEGFAHRPPWGWHRSISKA